ncbi:nitrogen regulation protein NR(II) [Natrarchaeobius sp. A-rgal3]|uniref:two-component system sensor histidine kinase NtrB n=1 Tax=Natrarchaeobius versutus TaxID=1679078 RepID=UPI0035106231
MDHDELVSTFGETVGVEKAQSLLEDALVDLDLEPAESYSSHEVADICETIGRQTEGYLEIVATEIRVREKAQRRFDALIEELSEPVVAVSFQQSAPVVTSVNPAFEATFGYGEDAIGRSLPELLTPADERTDSLDVWFRSGDDCGTELDRLTAEGERRTFLFQSVVVSGFGGEIEGYGIYTDITEQKRRERALERQNEQLERFVSVVSHDLRNPLTVAQGNVELAHQLSTEPAVTDHLADALDAQERMEQLIDDLLALASQGRTVDDPHSVVLAEVVTKAWRYIETTNVGLVEAFSEELTIEADGDRLCQLFENLFRNAVEHGSTSPRSQTPKDAVEHGSTSHAKPSGSADAVEHGGDAGVITVRVGWDEGVLFVEDDGPGIPADERDDVFDHGYTTSSEGTGFGLAIVEAIVDAHGWAIDVGEGVEGGARFEIRGISVGSRP